MWGQANQFLLLLLKPYFPSLVAGVGRTGIAWLSAPCCWLAKNISATGIQFGKCFTNRISWDNILISLIKVWCAILWMLAPQWFTNGDLNWLILVLHFIPVLNFDIFKTSKDLEHKNTWSVHRYLGSCLRELVNSPRPLTSGEKFTTGLVMSFTLWQTYPCTPLSPVVLSCFEKRNYVFFSPKLSYF